MMDSDLRTLLARPPDRSLNALPGDIWAGVAERERIARLSKRLLLMQSAVLLMALVGSLLAGERWSRSGAPGPLDVFSPRMALSVSTRLADAHP